MQREERRIIRLDSNDNVVVATGGFEPESSIEAGRVVVRQSVPPGHKIATEMICRGGLIRKYDHPIGIVSRDIRPGEHLLTHNVDMWEAARGEAFGPEAKPVDAVALSDPAVFQGTAREDGKVATRNYI